jgi:membrane associated rhomboid family serine protease
VPLDSNTPTGTTVIPLRDIIPSRTFPFVTVAILVTNGLVFLFQASLAEQDEIAFIHAFGLVPADFSALNIVTSMFVHGGVFHFAGNMLYLWIFGDNVEDRMGHGRYLLFYLLCGGAAAAAQTVANPFSAIPMVGASGAIAGVMGAYLVLYPALPRADALPVSADALRSARRDPSGAVVRRTVPERARILGRGRRDRGHRVLGACDGLRGRRGAGVRVPAAGAPARRVVERRPGHAPSPAVAGRAAPFFDHGLR